ncbi:MAG TPA: hypothetical protein VK607_23465 [Kofleriaceae bacterium]|nr:hypothetical protein [Kofleriaceae bacterium]
MLALALVAAVIAGDHVVLRASPSRAAAQQAVLWRGDWLEVRGEQRGWLKVYDHRHERPGYIARAAARTVELDDKAAPGLRAVVDFLRDTPGSESLGIAYAGLYVKVAPPGAIDAALLVSLGAMADRLARRASTEAADGHAAQQLEVAQSWGIGFTSVERAAGVRTCYDGAAFRQALALAPAGPELATAVLGLTEPACDPQTAGATERRVRDQAALDLLARVDPAQIGGPIGNRIRIRRAVIGARLAWALGRGGDPAAARVADAAVSAFARVDRAELADDDAADFEAAALEVAASRWAAAAPAAPRKADPRLALAPGEPGETCITVETSATRCTHGQVWASSFRVAPDRADAVLAIEPLPGWLELWLFRRVPGGWAVDVLPPATEGPDLGYVELAGWSSDGARAVVVREARSDGAVHRTWQVVKLDALTIERQTSRLADLGPARAWITPEWRGRTLALR